MLCDQCPRGCRIDRTSDTVGFCKTGEDFIVSRAALHPWEEPPISGKNGSGTIFFAGCNLRCVFCQNREISREARGERMTDAQLRDTMLRLQDMGAHNINLVTPSHYVRRLSRLLEAVKPRLSIPVVWNSSAYESARELRALDGLVDIYLPDVKYHSSELSTAYSAAPDYFPVALAALGEMLRQVKGIRYNEDGTLLLSGVVVRHLILPACRKDSIGILRSLFETFGSEAFLLSLMCQYTPDFAMDTPFSNLHRRLTSFEYESVRRVADELGFNGFSQAMSSASASFTPKF